MDRKRWRMGLWEGAAPGQMGFQEHWAPPDMGNEGKTGYVVYE